MQESDLALIAHLMRRAGFGASREELEVLSARGYEAVVEDLIHPERFPDIDEDIAQRYFGISFGSKSQWIYRMVNTRRPLEEKIALFWHHVFATTNTVNGGAIMYLMGGSIAGRRRLKTGPSATFHRGQPYPMEGVMDVPSGTVSARPASMHGRRHEHQGGIPCLRSAP